MEHEGRHSQIFAGNHDAELEHDRAEKLAYAIGRASDEQGI